MKYYLIYRPANNDYFVGMFDHYTLDPNAAWVFSEADLKTTILLKGEELREIQLKEETNGVTNK